MGQTVLAVQNSPAAVVRILETRIAERLELARNLHEGGRRIILLAKEPHGRQGGDHLHQVGIGESLRNFQRRVAPLRGNLPNPWILELQVDHPLLEVHQRER